MSYQGSSIYAGLIVFAHVQEIGIDDKLGGEICLASHALVCLSMVYVRPDNQYHANSHCVRTLTLTPDIA